MLKTCEERPARVKTEGQDGAKSDQEGGANASAMAWQNVVKTCEERPTTVKTGQRWAKKMRKSVANGVVKHDQNVRGAPDEGQEGAKLYQDGMQKASPTAW